MMGAPMSRKDVAEIGIQLLQCVENMHSAGYIHGDIKPDNIMLNEQNKVTLIDFGFAEKFLLPDGSHRPNTGSERDLNPHFCSKNHLNKHTSSRRDDIIQVVYTLMCMKN